MKQKTMIMILLAASIALVSCTGHQPETTSADSGGHPDLTEQQQFIACSDCHKTETPDIYEEWYQSVHGISMVKCYQCHGTFENMVVVPQVSNCATCHMAAMEKCPKDKTCWECHPAHTFKADK